MIDDDFIKESGINRVVDALNNPPEEILGSETNIFLKAFGITEETARAASKFVSRSMLNTEDAPMEFKDPVKAFEAGIFMGFMLGARLATMTISENQFKALTEE